MPNLNSLFMKDNDSQDFEYLKKFPDLFDLRLEEEREDQLNDLSFINSLKNLHYFSTNRVINTSDISPLLNHPIDSLSSSSDIYSWCKKYTLTFIRDNVSKKLLEELSANKSNLGVISIHNEEYPYNTEYFQDGVWTNVWKV